MLTAIQTHLSTKMLGRTLDVSIKTDIKFDASESIEEPIDGNLFEILYALKNDLGYVGWIDLK